MVVSIDTPVALLAVLRSQRLILVANGAISLFYIEY
jgi:hypothetical protein